MEVRTGEPFKGKKPVLVTFLVCSSTHLLGIKGRGKWYFGMHDEGDDPYAEI
jgi:hypothetical protein